jgi:DNA (cytosine-5)-methyltransferase 1
MEIEIIGKMDHTIDHTFESANRVYGKNGICPTVPTNAGGDHVPKIIDCVAIRGRGAENEQQLEIRVDECTNSITTVQKDNMVLEKTKVVALDEQNQNIRHETFGTLTTDGSSPKHNNRVVLIQQATKEGAIPCEVGGVADLSYPDSKTRRGRVQGNGQICPTLTTENIPNRIEPWTWEIEGETYLIRIRKLTPRECWRLMGFNDDDFDKAREVNSDTQLYKQAGNSIVVPVLEQIFKQLLENNGDTCD